MEGVVSADRRNRLELNESHRCSNRPGEATPSPWLRGRCVPRGGIRREVPWSNALAETLGVIFQFTLAAEGHDRAITDCEISGVLAHEICGLGSGQMESPQNSR